VSGTKMGIGEWGEKGNLAGTGTIGFIQGLSSLEGGYPIIGEGCSLPISSELRAITQKTKRKGPSEQKDTKGLGNYSRR